MPPAKESKPLAPDPAALAAVRAKVALGPRPAPESSGARPRGRPRKPRSTDASVDRPLYAKAPSRDPEPGAISHVLSDEELDKLVAARKAKGLPVKYNLDGKPSRAQFNHEVRTIRRRQLRLMRMDAEAAIERTRRTYSDRDISDAEMADIGRRLKAGEITMEEAKMATLYKYERDPCFMFPRLFRDMTVDRATGAYTPSPDFHRELIRLYLDNRRVAVCAPRGHAKAQPLTAGVLTPSGWKRIGDLRVGDEVVGSDGKPTRVTFLHPVSEMPLYRVTTRDGRSTLCNEEHLWTVSCPSNRGQSRHTLPLRTMMGNYASRRKAYKDHAEGLEYRYFLDPVAPVQHPVVALPIDPYSLGAWLGDGTSAAASITTADPELLGYLAYPTRKLAAKLRYGIYGGFQRSLRLCGLLGNKHVPDAYLTASVAQRLALLRGLMDTDGSLQVGGRIAEFCNTNQRLVDGVVSLVRSLGGMAVVSRSVTRLGGREFPYMKVTIRFPMETNPFLLRRKAEKWMGSRSLRSAIVCIEPAGLAPARCITVENPDGLYVTDDYLLTHNSTVTGFFYVLHQALFKKKKNIVLVSATEDLAIRFLRDIKAELEANVQLQWLFGIQRSEKWSEKEIQLLNGCRIYAKGRGGQMRGLKERGTRPDLIVLDDLEDSEIVRSEVRRLDLEDWFNGDVLPTVDPGVGQVVVIGTILHEDSLLSRLMDKSLYPDFATARYRAIIDDEHGRRPLWPGRFTLGALDAIRDSYAARGQLSTYFMEYMNDPVPSEGATFTEEMFQFFDRLPDDPFSSDLVRELFVDLGGGGLKRTADPTAMVVAVTDRATGDIYVEDLVNRRFGTDADAIIAALIDIARRNRVSRVYVEKTQAVNLLAASLDREMRRRRVPFTVEFVQATRGSSDRRGNMSDGKFQRIAQMEAPVRTGRIRFRRWMTELTGQLVTFPRGQHDDLIDALSYAYMFAKRKKRDTEGKRFVPKTRNSYLKRHYEA